MLTGILYNVPNKTVRSKAVQTCYGHLVPQNNLMVYGCRNTWYPKIDTNSPVLHIQSSLVGPFFGFGTYSLFRNSNVTYLLRPRIPAWPCFPQNCLFALSYVQDGYITVDEVRLYIG